MDAPVILPLGGNSDHARITQRSNVETERDRVRRTRFRVKAVVPAITRDSRRAAHLRPDTQALPLELLVIHRTALSLDEVRVNADTQRRVSLRPRLRVVRVVAILSRPLVVGQTVASLRGQAASPHTVQYLRLGHPSGRRIPNLRRPVHRTGSHRRHHRRDHSIRQVVRLIQHNEVASEATTRVAT